MLDPSTIVSIASVAVSLVAPLLQKAAEKGAEELGKTAASGLISRLKARLTHDGSKDALADLAQEPSDVAAQGALAMQLRKAVVVDPELAEFLKQWSSEAKAQVGISQTANIHGNENHVTQIVGSGNRVA